MFAAANRFGHHTLISSVWLSVYQHAARGNPKKARKENRCVTDALITYVRGFIEEERDRL